VDTGLLAPQGERRGRYYTAGELVKQIAKRARIPREEADPFAELAALTKNAEAPIQPELPGFSDAATTA